MNLTLAKQENKAQLAKQFKENGYVKVTHALSEKTLNKIHGFIVNQEQWNLVFNHKGEHQDLNSIEVEGWSANKKQDLQDIVFQQASNGFQYFYETIPIYDIFQSNLLPDHFFNDIVRFLNTEATLAFFREILDAPQITFMDAQITRFSAGHFLNTHNDDVQDKNRVAAFVINLTEHWRADWGGALHLLNEQQQIKQSFLPSFNEINIFKIPLDHHVGYVSPFATGRRLAITGWLRSGEHPTIK
jgi:Rps23 Pro-64 3,4-dihydroxylase Tpa1-like proline 4-hydroxylase